MLALLDIGNTAVTYGLYEGGRLLKSGSKPYSDIPKIANKFFKSGDKNNINAVICSVVPKYTQLVCNLFKLKNASVWVVNHNLQVPIRHRYRSLKKLGADRIVNVYGAVRMHKLPLLILDYGTAITADYVSAKGVFEGGMIIPGPELSFQALIERAALLPKKIRLPKSRRDFLGTTTYDCMSSGILEGYAAMTEGLIQRFKSKFGNKLRVLATGGFAAHLKPFVRGFDIVDDQHSIKSLLILFKDHQKKLLSKA